MSDNAILSVRQLKKDFRIGQNTVEVLDGISFDVRRGEFISIVGESGCGKSTLLKLITALENVTAGEILIDGEAVTGPTEKCTMIFQEPRLFPWLNVEKNITFTLSPKISKQEKKELAKKHIELVGLGGFEKALPSQLSGGMQQRVSIARALATSPELLLLDEPFGALDAFTRINLQDETLKIHQKQKATMLLVTHDIDEAIYLSDRIIVLSAKPGHIKADIKVSLPRPRKRSDLEFLQIRRQVMLELFENSSGQDIEYYI